MSGGAATALQTIASLAAVLALIVLGARLLTRVSGRGGDRVLAVLARQSLGRTSSIAVVRVADRAYVLGVTEAQVTLLDDVDLTAMTEAIATRPAPAAPGAGLATGTGAPAALTGSVFSGATWRQGLEAVRDRTARR